MNTADSDTRFRRIAAAGIFFQGGAAAIDTSTIVAALVPTIRSQRYLIGFGSYESKTYRIDCGRKGFPGTRGTGLHRGAAPGFSGAFDFAVRRGLGR